MLNASHYTDFIVNSKTLGIFVQKRDVNGKATAGPGILLTNTHSYTQAQPFVLYSRIKRDVL